MPFTLLYNIALALLFLVTLPKLLYQLLFLKKYRQSFWQRLGFNFPHIPPDDRPLIWIHAVSVGETKAIAALAKKLKEQNVRLLISSITETGHAEAKRSVPFADHFVFLPFDFSWIINPIVKRVQPKLVICSETDLWYNFLKATKDIEASNVIVNGKISERSYKRLKVFSFFAKRLLSLIDLFAVQNEEYKKRFEDLGINPAHIHVTGNLKLDQPVEISSTDTLKQTLGLTQTDIVILVGSTHAPEEKLILTALQPLMHEYPHLKILLIPRHPERFQSVASILPSFNLPYGKYSTSTSGRITLIDTMGILKQCLQVTHLAIIGGSFIPGIGGHNITEPAQYGVPVFFGPYMHSQPDFTEMILKSGAGEQVAIEDLKNKVRSLLTNQEQLNKMGLNGRSLLNRMQGSMDKTYQLIEKTIF